MMKSLLKTCIAFLISFFLCIILLYFTFLFADRVLFKNRATVLPGNAIESCEVQMHTMNFYPYTGWQTQEDFHQTGVLPHENKSYKNYDFYSGDKGFFTTFPIHHPPPKQKNEFRIVLIGGSGAQGWGGQTNQNMLASQIENQLNAMLAEQSIKVRVINMAMGSTISYQNYIALNLWGHQMEPDLILSYSGRNDFVVPCDNLSDAIYQFYPLLALVRATRTSDSPPWIKFCSEHFPNIFNKTSLGLNLRIFFCYHRYLDDSKKWYQKVSGTSNMTSSDVFEKVAKPFYIHAFQSIKRDFDGIPIMIAWQALSRYEKKVYADQYGLQQDFYSDFYKYVVEHLKNFKNNQWYFVDPDEKFSYITDGTVIYTHLSNEGHQMIGQYLAEELKPIILQLKNKTPRLRH